MKLPEKKDNRKITAIRKNIKIKLGPIHSSQFITRLFCIFGGVLGSTGTTSSHVPRNTKSDQETSSKELSHAPINVRVLDTIEHTIDTAVLSIQRRLRRISGSSLGGSCFFFYPRREVSAHSFTCPSLS